jgi:2-aminoadipate transaminase
MSLKKRKRLLEIAKRRGLVILEDNPYGELRFEGEPLPTLKSLDDSGNVIYVGSFSKIFSPGLRLAYMVCDRGITEKIVVGKHSTDVHTNIFAQMILSEYLKK